MKLTPSSTARLKTANAPLRSFGGPHIPLPVTRMAPKPRRWTEALPPSETVPAKLAETFFVVIRTSSPYSLLLFARIDDGRDDRTAFALLGRERRAEAVGYP